MPTGKQKFSATIPSLDGWGGIRSVQRRLERSATIVENREAVAYLLLCMAKTKITDIMDWDDDGTVRFKGAGRIPEHALQAIKNVRVTKGKDGQQTLEIELFDKVQVLRLLAKASGLLDKPEDDEKPSVIDVNVVAPRGEGG